MSLIIFVTICLVDKSKIAMMNMRPLPPPHTTINTRDVTDHVTTPPCY